MLVLGLALCDMLRLPEACWLALQLVLVVALAAGERVALVL